MKHKSNITKSLFFFIIVSVIPLYTKQVPLSFDSLFPSTWFKKALDSCMQAWDDMQLFQERGQHINQDDHQLLLDATVGRLVYAHFCLEHMVKIKHKVIADDIAYLIQVVEHIQQVSDQEKKCDNDERLLCIQKISNQLKLFLEKVIVAHS